LPRAAQINGDTMKESAKQFQATPENAMLATPIVILKARREPKSITSPARR